jgi:hypothetical protein
MFVCLFVLGSCSKKRKAYCRPRINKRLFQLELIHFANILDKKKTFWTKKKHFGQKKTFWTKKKNIGQRKMGLI